MHGARVAEHRQRSHGGRLVVGSGAGALTAALVASELGATPLVIEKGTLWGGTSASSGGTAWIPCSRHMEEAGVADTPDEALAYLQALVGEETPEGKLRAYIHHAAEMIDFLEACGGPVFRCLDYADYHMELPGAKGHRTHECRPITAGRLGRDYASLQPTHPGARALGRINWTAREARPIITRKAGWWRAVLKVMGRYWLDVPQRLRTTRDRRLTGGNALLAGLRRALNARDVPVRLGVALRDLLVEEGRVVGAAVDDQGKHAEIRVRRGVILGAGGFEHDATMRRDHFGADSATAWSGSQQNNTGDAVRAAARAGAALDLMDSAWWAPVLRLADEDRARPLFVERSLPGCLIVNQLGKRYLNESASYHVVGGEMLRRNRPECPSVPSWFVFDAAYRAKYAVGPMLPGPPRRDSAVRQSFRAQLRKAGTVTELAASMNIDGEALHGDPPALQRVRREGAGSRLQPGRRRL